MKFIFYIFSLLIALLSCTPKNGEKEIIRIAVTASMEGTMRELTKAFQKRHKNYDIQVISGSSGKLFAQIINHAPFDLFVSADMEYPQQLKLKGFVNGAVREYAEGILIVSSFSEINLSQLSSDKIRKIAVASPSSAPFGRATMEYLSHLPDFHLIEKKIAYGENVNQVNHYIKTGVVDVGFTSLSSVKLIGGKYKRINPENYNPIKQGVCLLKRSRNRTSVKEFFDYLFSEEGQFILSQNGYKVKQWKQK